MNDPATSSSDEASVPTGLRHHFARTASLAWPVVLSRAGILVMVSVDVAMTGQAGQTELAFISIGMAPHVIQIMIGVGMLYGTAVLVAQAHGAGEHLACGGIWRRALILAAIIGTLLGLLSLGGEWFLLAVGQTAEIAEGGGRVLLQFAWSLPAMLVAVTTTLFLEGINRSRAGMIVMMVANGVNFGLNWLLVYGDAGLPALGAEGAVIATSITRYLIAAALIAYAFLMPGSAQYGVRRGVMAGPEVGRKLFRIGYPFGIAQGIEASAFSGLVLMAGLVGTAALGGYQIAQNLIALVYMAAIGISVATAVRVGNAVGRADRPGVAAAGWTGVGLVILVMAVIALVFARVPELLVSIYSSDQAVVSVAASTVLIAAALLVFDGMQGVLMGALRGAGDVWMPVVMHMISFYLVALPAAAIMAFVLGYGAPGLMMGMFGGVLCAAVLMSWRFRVISSRAVRRL